MTNIATVSPSRGADAGKTADRLANNIVLDILESALGQAGVKQSPETKDAMQDMRDLVNDNLQGASKQCGGKGKTGGAQEPQKGSAGGKETPLMMLMLLLMLMQKLMQGDQPQQGQGQGQGQSQGAPQGGETNELANFFYGLSDSFQQANHDIADKYGIKYNH